MYMDRERLERMSQNRKILKNCVITGFADEIDANVDKQLALLKQLGITYVEFRSGDGINVADYTLEQVKTLKQKLDDNGIRVSAIGSPIGKIGIEDAFAPHLKKLSHVMDIAEILDSKYIRMFSFFMPDEKASGKKVAKDTITSYNKASWGKKVMLTALGTHYDSPFYKIVWDNVTDKKVEILLDCFGEDEKEIMLLHFKNGLSIYDISSKLHISAGRITKVMSNAFDSLIDEEALKFLGLDSIID